MYKYNRWYKLAMNLRAVREYMYVGVHVSIDYMRLNMCHCICD